jgi:hypothetical protein
MKSIIQWRRRVALCWLGLVLLTLNAHASESVWQWSVPVGQGRAFLWIPPDCSRIRAVMVGQHNMSEEGIFENETMRRELARLGMAEVWIAPPVDGPFDFTQGAGERFEATLSALAQESGYGELAFAPVIPIGHSACATYPWNFTAWNPGRTLAAISVHGDAPQTKLTGYGRANIAWGDRNIDGVPSLMVMAEYEWLEDRLAPALKYRIAHPAAPIAMLAEPGRGHFDISDDLISFLVMFIRKTAEYRLPADDAVIDRAPLLKAVDPASGWLVQRWRLDQPRIVSPAPVAKYTGDSREAFWAFDEEMALAMHHYRSNQMGKHPQLLGWSQGGKTVKQTNAHHQVGLRFEPREDGITFHLNGVFLDAVDGGSPNTTRWTGLPAGAPIAHATASGPITLSRITGPVVQIAPDTFRVQLNRTASTSDRRNFDIWLLASHPGDANFKSAVQQALMKIAPNTEGSAQTISFPKIADQHVGAVPLNLQAASDSRGQISYYMREGPAVVEGSTMTFTALPPRTKFPVKVTVVAWQWGRSVEPKLRTATPVEQTFLIMP